MLKKQNTFYSRHICGFVQLQEVEKRKKAMAELDPTELLTSELLLSSHS